MFTFSLFSGEFYSLWRFYLFSYYFFIFAVTTVWSLQLHNNGFHLLFINCRVYFYGIYTLSQICKNWWTMLGHDIGCQLSLKLTAPKISLFTTDRCFDKCLSNTEVWINFIEVYLNTVIDVITLSKCFLRLLIYLLVFVMIVSLSATEVVEIR